MRANRTLRSIVLILCVALLSIPGAALAQNFRLINPPGGTSKSPEEWPPFTHWDLREMPDCKVPWILGTASVPDLDGNGVGNEPADRNLFEFTCESAFNTWSAVSPSRLTFYKAASGVVPVGGFVADDFNTMSWSSTALGMATLGATVIMRNATTGVISEADIIFNSFAGDVPGFGFRHWVFKSSGVACDADIDYAPTGNWPTAADGDTDVNGNGQMDWEVDLQTVATHEIGHFLGLDHIDPLGGHHNDASHAIMEQFWQLGIGPTGSGWANHTLGDPDTDGDNFLYCPDLGDAPDPWMGAMGQYPSLVHLPQQGRMLNGLKLDGIATGAEHIFGIAPRQAARNWTYEWLGRFDASNVSPECEANIVDRDQFDDGVTWYPNPPVWGRNLCVRAWVRYAADNLGNAHNYLAHPLYVNGWLDINQDCVWTEHFLQAGLTPAPPALPNEVRRAVATGCIALPLAADPTLPVWLRVRLDYGENVGAVANIDGTLANDKGAAQLGEVEDYPFFCRTRYEQHWLINPFPFPIPGISFVFVGPPMPSDQVFAAAVDAGDCVQSTDTPEPPHYEVALDETTIRIVPPVLIPPFTFRHWGICRPYSPSTPPMEPLRPYWLDPSWPADYYPAAAEVPAANRIPTTNVSYKVYQPGQPQYGNITFTVGAVDLANGGWIDGPDPTTDQWSDTLRVSVGYRLSAATVPLASLSPCDPAYNALPLTTVGDGLVTPEDGFDFDISAADLGSNQSVIVEVRSSWSTNPTVNQQMVEFSSIEAGPTPVTHSPEPSRLTLANYPNPFNPTTTIRFTLPVRSDVTLKVYDVSGSLVRTLIDHRTFEAGFREVEWNGRDDRGNEISSGVYFYRLTAGDETLTRKAVLLK